MHPTSVPRCVAVISMFACVPAAANENLAGDWMLELRSEDAPVVGMLQLEFVDGAWMAYVEGGPVEVEVESAKAVGRTSCLPSRDRTWSPT